MDIDPPYGGCAIDTQLERRLDRLAREKERIARDYARSAAQGTRMSFRRESDKYMRPYFLIIDFPKRSIHAKIVHRAQHTTVASVGTNSRDLKAFLPDKTDLAACRFTGELLARRAKEADCYAVAFNGSRVEGRLAVVIDSLVDCGISVYRMDREILLSREPGKNSSFSSR
ncbi:uncharacterized protein LOC9637422 [Selaginella moellendorffii]|nr:uncharacterized protein LOC9637422 [Selaginella moellendorffii]|eukprot:XP_002974657.2 uncharacterized protein LOC9637422 [Selaginella moellendorffii]